MLGPDDVGHRVVVRRRVGMGRGGRTIYTDLLGELMHVDDDHLVVRDEDGTDHGVARDVVVAAKRVPPRPARFSEIAALERVTDAAWPAPVHERLGDWFLRAAEGWTNRANSALPLGDPGLPLDEAVRACAAWYRRHEIPALVTVPLPLRRDVADVLTTMGWHARPPVLVQTARLADLLRPVEPTGTLTELTEQPTPGFLDVIAARKGRLPPAAQHVLSALPAVRFAATRAAAQQPARDDGDPALLAVARGAVVAGWLHVSLVDVIVSARRRGLATWTTHQLAQWARHEGAVRAVLQVEEDNLAAAALYERMGFRTHHRYVTFAAPGPTPHTRQPDSC